MVNGKLVYMYLYVTAEFLARNHIFFHPFFTGQKRREATEHREDRQKEGEEQKRGEEKQEETDREGRRPS